MKNEFSRYDFYKIGPFHHTIISEKLKTDLETNKVTGYNFTPFKALYVDLPQE